MNQPMPRNRDERICEAQYFVPLEYTRSERSGGHVCTCAKSATHIASNSGRDAYYCDVHAERAAHLDPRPIPSDPMTTPDTMMMLPERGTNETAVAAVEAQAKAAVQARWIMAIQRPRDIDVVRERLLKECRRPGFAREALYSIPRGGTKIEGPTIRFAEAAIRCMTNIYTETPVVYDDAEKRIVSVQVTDLETNVTFGQTVVIAKTVERRSIKQGEVALRTRVGSEGQTLYILPASQDEIGQRQNAIVSKALRTHGLRHFPGWLVEECEAQIRKTNSLSVGDPDQEKKKILDGFNTVGVSAAQVREFVGHDLSVLQPRELQELRGVFQAVADGEMTFAEAMEQKHPPKTTEEE